MEELARVERLKTLGKGKDTVFKISYQDKVTLFIESGLLKAEDFKLKMFRDLFLSYISRKFDYNQVTNYLDRVIFF